MGLLQWVIAQTGEEAAKLLSGDKGEVLLIIALWSIFINRSFIEKMTIQL